MKAVVFHGIGDIRLDDVPEPKPEDAEDAIVRLTATAICGTDLHFVRGTFTGMTEGRVLGHEGVGVVEEVGKGVRNFRPGDRVVVGSTIACGRCSYCRAGYFAQCDVSNPNGPGTAFFGGPDEAGGYDGLQAEYARVPYAHTTMVHVPDGVTDEQALMISDVFPTGWFGAHLAEIEDGDTVAVFGCGPVGQFAIASAKLMGAGRVFAVDTIADRLETARAQGAEAIDFNADDPVETLTELTGGAGPDRVIDAVGVDADAPEDQPTAREQADVAPAQNRQGDNWHPGSSPAQALEWAVEAVAKGGTLAIVGVYPPALTTFPVGQAMMKNLTVKAGNCNHRRYLRHLLELARSGAVDPARVITRREPVASAIDAYRESDRRQPGWLKVELEPAAAASS